MRDRDLSETIAGAQSGDPGCFDALIDVYARRLYGFFFRLTGSTTDAEDLLQELFVRLVRSIGGYEHRDQFDAFLFRIAANLHRDHLRKKRRTPQSISLDAADGKAQGGFASAELIDRSAQRPEHSLELSEAGSRLQEALAELPEAEREVILLRHYSAMSFNDIAATMGTPLGTALARAHRGLNKLRALMTEHA